MPQSTNNQPNVAEEDLIVPLGSTTVSSPMNRVTGASPKVKCPTMAGSGGAVAVATSSSTARSNSSNKWDPPLLCPLPPTFLRLTSNEVQRMSNHMFHLNFQLHCPLKCISGGMCRNHVLNHLKLFSSTCRLVRILTFQMNNSQSCYRMRSL